MRRDSAPSATRVRFACWASAVAIASAVWACGRPAAEAPPPPKVTVVLPVEREVTEWDEYTARFDAVDSVEVRPRVNGYLQEIHFKVGAMVKKGDLLFLIDPRPYEAARRRTASYGRGSIRN